MINSITFDKSFASHEKAKYWSIKNLFKPEEVSKCSNIKYWFNCDKCPHDFNSILSNINKGKWCPYCSNHKICNNNDCIMCYNKSFASHEKSIFWSSKNISIPREVFKSSSKIVFLNCNYCNHCYSSSLNNINKGQGCPYCSNHKICDDNDCIMCYNNSFASHEKAIYWSNKNYLSPRNIFTPLKI